MEVKEMEDFDQTKKKEKKGEPNVNEQNENVNVIMYECH